MLTNINITTYNKGELQKKKKQNTRGHSSLQGDVFMTCTFFGHRDAPASIRPLLKNTLLDLIEKQNVTKFYVGNQGKFDAMACSLLQQFAKSHGVDYTVVLAYMPIKPDPFLEANNTILPEGIENVPRRFAIEYRNRWMIDQSDIVVTYVQRSFGGAAKFKDISKKKGKTVLELSECPPR